MKSQFIVNQMISLFFICAFSVSVSGQETYYGDVQKSPEMDAHIRKFIKQDNGDTYAIRAYSPKKVYLERFDKKLNLISSEKMTFKYEGKQLSYVDLITYKNKVKLITSFYNKKQKKGYVFAQDFDVTKNQATNLKTLTTIENESQLGGFITTSNFVSSPFEVKFSNDSSKIVLIYDFSPLSNINSKLSLKACVLDTDFNVLWQKEKNFDSNPNEYSILNDILVDNNGNVYLSTFRKMYDERGRKNLGGFFIIYEWYNKGESLNDYAITPENMNIASAKLVDNNGKIKVIGRYTLKNTTATTKGFFIGELNSNLKVLDYLKSSEIDLNQLGDLYSEELITKLIAKEFELEYYDIKDIIINDNGTISIVIEKNDIIIFNYSDDFTLNWLRVVDRGVSGGVPSHSSYLDDSYILHHKDNKLYFLFSIAEKQSIGTNLVDYLSIVDEKGSLEKLELNIAKLKLISISTDVSYSPNQNELIFYKYHGRFKYSLGKLIIE